MERSAEVKEAAALLYATVSSGDMPAIEWLFSSRDGVLAIGTDEREWWSHYGTMMKVFKAQMEEMGGGFPVVAGGTPPSPGGPPLLAVSSCPYLSIHAPPWSAPRTPPRRACRSPCRRAPPAA